MRNADSGDPLRFYIAFCLGRALCGLRKLTEEDRHAVLPMQCTAIIGVNGAITRSGRLGVFDDTHEAN
jgi:hypothetical protein